MLNLFIIYFFISTGTDHTVSPTTESGNVSEKKVSESSSTTVPGIRSTTDTTPITDLKNVSESPSNTAPGTCSTTVAAATSSSSTTTDPTDAKLDALLGMVNVLKSQNETKKGFPPTNSTTTSSSTTTSTDKKLDALLNMFNVLKSEPESQKGYLPTNSTANTYPRSNIEQMAPHVKQNDFSVGTSTTSSVTKEDFEQFKSEMRSLSARGSERFATSAQSMPGMYLHKFLFIQKRFYIVLTNLFFLHTQVLLFLIKKTFTHHMILRTIVLLRLLHTILHTSLTYLHQYIIHIISVILLLVHHSHK